MLKDNKCFICEIEIPLDRGHRVVTCSRKCAKKYMKVVHYIHSSYESKYKIENRELKKQIKKLQATGCKPLTNSEEQDE